MPEQAEDQGQQKWITWKAELVKLVIEIERLGEGNSELDVEAGIGSDPKLCR